MKNNTPLKMRIFGIDPGTQVTGFGVIEINIKGEITLCDYGCIKTGKNESLPVRLKQIYDGLVKALEKYKPDTVALENIFYSENIKTAIVMGHARGVSLLAPINIGMEPVEYSPREVKLAVTGRGSASKSQVQFMVKTILNMKEEIESADAADALAVAICHHNRMKNKINLKF